MGCPRSRNQWYRCAKDMLWRTFDRVANFKPSAASGMRKWRAYRIWHARHVIQLSQYSARRSTSGRMRTMNRFANL